MNTKIQQPTVYYLSEGLVYSYEVTIRMIVAEML
jgi:hypothetical protein